MGWVTEHHPTTSELEACVQCGLCLPVCPTFRLTGRETASPRGRLHAMMAVHQGVVEVDQAFAGLIDFCLGCRACEPVCPGLVPYGRALEGTRAEIVAQLPGRNGVLGFLLGKAVAWRGPLGAGSSLISAAQRAGLAALVRGRLAGLLGGLRPLRRRPPSLLGHAGGEGRAGSVALLAGCVQDQWFRPVNQAAVTLLEMGGHRVEVPRGQTCCGALAAHHGAAADARRLAERNTEVLAGFDQVVATAAGCSAHLADYRHWSQTGSAVAAATVDITVAVARAIEEGRLPRIGEDRGPIAVQDPCHLRHAQRVVAEPRLVLEAAGHQVVEIDEVGLCCGAAGSYTITQPEASAQLGNQKADQIRSKGVTRVASANPGCEMQLRRHLPGQYQIAHPIEWYLESLRSSRSG